MKTALVVDDTKNIRLLLSKCLENENYIVHSAQSAPEALNLISKYNFDIAFIDIKMPNMSGTALLELIRTNGHTFPVIIMTAFGTIKNAVTTTQMGARAYLQKPFTAVTIRKTLLEVFPYDIFKVETLPKDIDEKNISFHNLKISTLENVDNSNIYKEIGEKLITLGEIEKGELFKDFSAKLNILNSK